MGREIQAVDQEFEGCFTQDDCRMELVLQEQIDSSSVLAKFGWGNIKSL